MFQVSKKLTQIQKPLNTPVMMPSKMLIASSTDSWDPNTCTIDDYECKTLDRMYRGTPLANDTADFVAMTGKPVINVMMVCWRDWKS